MKQSSQRHDTKSAHTRSWSDYLKQPVYIAGLLVIVASLAFAIRLVSGNDQGTNNSTGSGSNESNGQGSIVGRQLYVDPQSNAAKQVQAWQGSDPAKAATMQKLADQPSSLWLSNGAVYDDIERYVLAANDKGQLPVLVTYYIPNRDCNQYSSGGAKNQDEYTDYIDTIAQAIGTMDAVVILEPDALVHMQSTEANGQPCIDEPGRHMYTTLIKYAVDRLKSLPGTSVYIDAGNSGWTKETSTIAALLRGVGIERADGFSLNVSNFRTNEETIRYGNAISKLAGDKHYVIDTSRNGNGAYENPANPGFNWCNPPDRALGHYPTTNTNVPLVDAYLYIKNVGESDGSDPDTSKCFGGPKAGQYWADYALGLVQRWPQELQPNGR